MNNLPCEISQGAKPSLLLEAADFLAMIYAEMAAARHHHKIFIVIPATAQNGDRAGIASRMLQTLLRREPEPGRAERIRAVDALIASSGNYAALFSALDDLYAFVTSVSRAIDHAFVQRKPTASVDALSTDVALALA